jgi:serine/threonine-protein kinase HipA
VRVRIKPGTPLPVALDFGAARRVQVGRLALVDGIAALGYDAGFRTAGLSINPYLAMPPDDRAVMAPAPRIFDGLHGVFADSLPDTWGEVLTRRRAERAGIPYRSLTMLDRLAAVGRTGMGALVYEPEIELPGTDAAAIDLDALASDAMAVLEGHASELLDQLSRLGGSPGGARPKILVGLDAKNQLRAGEGDVPAPYEHWLVKFRGPKDPGDVGRLEAAYAEMARTAGLDVSPTRLLETPEGPGYFATRRFDRDGGKRLHVLSFAGMLDTEWHTPTIDYADALSLVRRVTARDDDVERMVRRMFFNVVAHNRDDHAKQHAFVMDSDGVWRLAPAYDLTYAQGPGGEHYLAVGGYGRDIPKRKLLEVAEEQIGARRAAEALARVVAAVADFAKFAKRFHVGKRTTSEVMRAIDPILKEMT